jgi:hypothetical protein
MKVASVHEAARRYVRNSVRAFVEGQQNLKWISGILRHSGLTRQEILPLLLPLKEYGNTARATELRDWLESASW